MNQSVFVGREGELTRLSAMLDAALDGQAQLCFVAGDAGAGKSALVGEFARRAGDTHDALVVAVGECNAQTGLGDPFLPFREVLAQLTGGTEAALASGQITRQNAERLARMARFSSRALVEVAPALINSLIPGSAVVAILLKFGAERAGWLGKLEKQATSRTELKEEIIFQQTANLLGALVQKQPLILVLDDLHWADQASISLLFHLNRALKDARLLIIGAYRPNDVALGRDGKRHPLEGVLNEIRRYRGDVVIDLNEADEATRRSFVNELLDDEPNRLSQAFRDALFARTGGYPLFTVELLGAMKERGDLCQDEQGNWVEESTLDWDALPARVEGVIAERIERLDGELRDILQVASVEGEAFTVQIIARLQELRERDLLKALSGELEKQHRLVREGDEVKVGRQRLWRYHFSHVLFQTYLYDELSRGERRLLHGELARSLEEIYAGQTDDITLQLARHFEEAGEDDRAAIYRKRAGELAVTAAGNVEAVRHFSRALDLVAEDDWPLRFDLLEAREKIYHLQGERQAQLQDIEALEALAERLDDDRRRAGAELCRARYAQATSDFPAMSAAAEQAVGLAAANDAIEMEVEGYRLWGDALHQQGARQPARERLEHALSLARSADLRRAEANVLRQLGIVSPHKDNRGYYEASLKLHRELGDRFGEARTLNQLGIVAFSEDDYDQARAALGKARQLFREIGFRLGEGATLGNLGTLAARVGDYPRARASYEALLPMSREIGNRASEVRTLVELAFTECYAQGDMAAAREWATSALEILEELNSPFLESRAQLVLGHALSEMGQWRPAVAAYEEMLRLEGVRDGDPRPLEAFAGLAWVALRQGDLQAAQGHVEKILTFLQSYSLEGPRAASLIYLISYQVLQAAGDPRAGEVLQAGYDFLQERVAHIHNEEDRRSFLENVPYNRELLAAYNAR